MAQFKATQGTKPVSVNVNDSGVQVSFDSNTYKFDADLKPIAIEKPNATIYYRNQEAGLENMKAATTNEGPVQPQFSGKERIPEALKIISDVSSQPGFPAEITAKLPEAYAKLGLQAPARQVG